MKIRASSPRGRPRSPIRNDSRDLMRGRGRDWEPRGGRGRGIYFDSRGELRGRRSRSPERDRPRQDRPPDSWDKSYVPRPLSSIALSQTRENPSPPPQAPEVPAFGSVVSNASGGQMASVSATVAIPTGPRSERSPHSYGGRQEYPGSIQWTNPKLLAVSAKLEMPVPPIDRKPQEPPKPKTPERVAQPEVPKDVVEKRELVDTGDHDTSMMEAGEVDERPRLEEVVTLTRKPPTDYISPEDEETSDSDIDDDYFEDEISKVKNQISQGTPSNTLEMFTSISIPFNEESQLRSPIPPPTPPQPVFEPKEVSVKPADAPIPTPMELDHVPVADAVAAVIIAVSPPIAPKKLPEIATPSEELESLVLETKVKMRMSIPPAEELGDESAAEEQQELEAVRKKMKTPPVSRLPFTAITPWNLDTDFIKSVEPNPDVMDFLVASLESKADIRDREVEENSRIFKQKYKEWILFHRSNDPLAVRCRERWEAHRAAEVSRAASLAPSENRTEGRRAASRFATEHDIERLLRQSEIEAREQRERSDRVAKAKAADEKEAVIPDMLSVDERESTRFGDYTNLVSPDRALAMFEVLPPIADFTELETENFEKAMLEFPKQWGKIAEALPGRNYKHCIQYYYLVKHELHLKEKLKRRLRSKGRKRKPKTSVHTVALGRDEVEEEPAAEGTNERRRPKRAAAPTFGIEATPNESDNANANATGVPVSGRRVAATPKDSNGEPTTGKRKGKAAAAREKAAKQTKNSQLLAAAPSTAAPKNREELKAPVPHPLPIKEWQQPIVPPPEPARFSGPTAPWDGSSLIPPPYTTPSVVLEKQVVPLAASHDVPMPLQTHPGQDRLGSAPPGATYDPQQQNQRNNAAAPTSSYWSVPEQNDFPMLLEHFGTDWHGIAKWMASKTHIMVYTTVFHNWLIVPSDSNKSRRVANLQQQVKNYYQRQIDSGKSDLEEIARIADEKRARGESTGPPPTPTNHPIKRKYDGPTGSPQRPLGLGPMPDDIDEMYPGGQLPPQQGPGIRFSANMPPGTGRFDSFAPPMARPSGAIGNFELDDKRSPGHPLAGQHESSPQTAVARFPTLAQAGSLPQAANAPRSAASSTKHIPQTQNIVQQMQQQRPPRGPPLGYFNNDSSRRPILQASSSHPSPQPLPLSDPVRTTQRSHMVAQEAQLERQQALRLEEEQRQQARQQQLRLKQETDMQNFSQFEQYPPQHPQQLQQRGTLGHLRNEPNSPVPAEERERKKRLSEILTQTQYPPPPPRNFSNALNDMKGSTGPPTPATSAPSGISRSTMSVPPHQQQSSVPPPQSPAVAALRQQEPVRKTSSIMSLLNDEPSEPVAPKRAPESQPSAMKPSPSPAPQQQPYQQAPRQISSQPSHIRRESSLSDIRGNIVPQPQRASTIPQGPVMSHERSPYSVPNTQPPPQTRQHAGSPLESNAPEPRDYYAHQQYLIQQQHQHQQTAVSSPQVTMPYQTQQSQQPQQPQHRSIAFATSSHHPASPNLAYTHASLHGSRHNSFDARQQQGLPPSASQAPQQPSYGSPQLQVPPPYQAQPPQQHTLQSSRFPQQPQPAQPRASPLGQQMNAQAQQQNQQIQPQAQHAYGLAPQRAYTPSYETHGGRGYAPPSQQQQQQQQGMERMTAQQQRQQEEEAMLRRGMMRGEGFGAGIDRRAEEAYQRELEERRVIEERRHLEERDFRR